MEQPGIKIGDFVESKSLASRGVVQDVEPCDGGRCEKYTLTLDKAGSGVRFYYHLENFEVVASQEKHAL